VDSLRFRTKTATFFTFSAAECFTALCLTIQTVCRTIFVYISWRRKLLSVSSSVVFASLPWFLVQRPHRRGGKQIYPISLVCWKFIHPSIFFTPLSLSGVGRVAGASPANVPGERWGHLATQRHTGQTTMHTHTHTSRDNLDRPINLTVMFLDCGRKPEKTHHAQGEHANSMQKDRGRESNPEPPCCKATALPTAPLCSPVCWKFWFLIEPSLPDYQVWKLDLIPC